MDLEEARNTSIEDEMGLGPAEAEPVQGGHLFARGAGKLIGGSYRMATCLSQRVKLAGQKIAGVNEDMPDTHLTLELENNALREDLEKFNTQTEEARQVNTLLNEQATALKKQLESALSEIKALPEHDAVGGPLFSPELEDLKKENEHLRLALEKSWSQTNKIDHENGILSQRINIFKTELLCARVQLKQAKSQDQSSTSEDAPVSQSSEDTTQTEDAPVPESSEDTAETEYVPVPESSEDTAATEDVPVLELSEDTAATEDVPVPESSEDAAATEYVPVPESSEDTPATEDVPAPESSEDAAAIEYVPVPESSEDAPQVFPDRPPSEDEIVAAVFNPSTDKVVFKKAMKDLAGRARAKRLDGARALGYVSHELSVRVLMLRLRKESMSEVRAELINALAKIGMAQAAPAVEEALKDGDATVRLAAVRGVYRLAGNRTGDLLIRMLTDQDESVRRRAVVCVGWLESPELAPTLLPLVSDASVSVRQVAVEALATLRNPVALPALIDQMEDPDESMRTLIVKTLTTISGKEMPKTNTKGETAYLRLVARWRQWWQEESAKVSEKETA